MQQFRWLQSSAGCVGILLGGRRERGTGGQRNEGGERGSGLREWGRGRGIRDSGGKGIRDSGGKGD